MLRKTNKKSSKVLACCLAMVTFMVAGLVGKANVLLAQELSEEVKMTAMVQYTLEYRFSKDLKVGDFVKYQLEEKTIELKVTKKEGSGVWIVEEFPGMKIHLLVDLKKMKLLKGFGFDEKGEKRVMNPMDDKKLYEVIAMFKNKMKQQGAYSQFISWKKGEKTEKIDVPAGSFACAYIKPEYSEKYKKQIENYVKQMQKQGKSDAEIDTEISKNEPRLYFNKDVPRLLSMQIAMGWTPWIDAFKEVKGGLVESKGMSPLKLIAYSGHKK